MKKIFLIPIFAFTAILVTISCSDDFLDVDTTENIAFDLEEINNDDGAKSLVTAIYNKFLDWNMSSFAWNGLTSIASDDADKGSDPGDTGTDKDKLDNLTHDPTIISVLEVFEANYQGINRANQALLILPQLDQADENLRNRLIGEAKFLRAFMYFNLVRTYGGVPIVDHVPVASSEADTEMTLTRRSKEDVYAFIEQDLLDAISVLPNKSEYASDEIGRASKGAALALMAKVSLYQQKWTDVITYATQITGYSLAPNYAEIWRESGENNIESIFEIQGFGGNPSKGIQGYFESQGARGAGGWGWGFNTPSESLVNAYEPNDVRRDATIIYAGETLWDGRFVPLTVSNPRYNEKAYVSNTQETFNGAWETNKNIRYLRYAEVLLMLAEAYNETSGDALTPLNQVRQRAGLLPTTASGQSAIRQAIWRERRVELAFEHDRFFDLVRTGQAQAAFTAHGKTFIPGKHEVFPLPQRFITESAGRSSQNPNY